MVDFRPLLFLNALVLMLLVTAGFASVRDEQPVAEAPTPAIEAVAVAPIPEVEAVAKTPAEPEVSPAPPEVNTEPFRIPEPAPAPKTGSLVLRSNVEGDQVDINGKPYGATRLDLELEPGKYDITISKPGFRPWQQSVVLDAGNERTLVGKLEAYTTVNYQNGVWTGDVKTGDGTYEDSDGLRYEGHFIDGAFHGQGTLTLGNGDILTGEWAQGRLNGHGSLATAGGMLYVGGLRDSDFHGRGTLTYPDGRHYEGDFSNGTFHGNGSEVFANGKKYEGEYIEGKFHGNGLLRNPNGSSIEATFRLGEPYGQVRLTTAAGEVFTARTTEPGVCYRDKSYRATQCPKLEGW